MENIALYELLLNLPSLKIVSVKVEAKRINIDCTLRSCSQKCPKCGLECKQVHQYYARTVRDLPSINIEDKEWRIAREKAWQKNKYFIHVTAHA